ncbi:UNVERIFIED_CONTAM: hypothetical protein HDU68_011859 [Siphonaria sp. JEL0065]|nr:hypothetical protein HDU68_011859 [Siphonaria sp. JEL0065]
MLGNVGVAKSMTGELTDKSNRPAAFAITGICMSIGTILGPMLGGSLSNPVTQVPWLVGNSELFKEYPYLLPCLCSAFFSFSVLIFGIFHLEETLTRVPAPLIAESSVSTLTDLPIEDESGTSANQSETVSSSKDVAFPPRAFPAVIGLGLLALTSIMNEEMYPLLSTLPRDEIQTGFGFTALDIGE